MYISLYSYKLCFIYNSQHILYACVYEFTIFSVYMYTRAHQK